MVSCASRSSEHARDHPNGLARACVPQPVTLSLHTSRRHNIASTLPAADKQTQQQRLLYIMH